MRGFGCHAPSVFGTSSDALAFLKVPGKWSEDLDLFIGSDNI
jgi:hypothetical protein